MSSLMLSIVEVVVILFSCIIDYNNAFMIPNHHHSFHNQRVATIIISRRNYPLSSKLFTTTTTSLSSSSSLESTTSSNNNNNTSNTTSSVVVPLSNDVEKTALSEDSDLSSKTETNSSSSNSLSSLNHNKKKKKKKVSTLLITTSILSAIILILWKQQQYGATFKSIIQFIDYVRKDWLILTLDKLNSSGIMGLVLYTSVLAIWEMTAGITTPVETAAGMAFGIKKGILASGCGKLSGAFLAFLLARRYYYTKNNNNNSAENKKTSSSLDTNNNNSLILDLIKESITEHPLRMALLCRFSPLPEIMKNASMGLIPTLPKRYFFLSLILHGFTFTCLWTCMGAETANLLRGYNKPSRVLKVLMAVATWIGFTANIIIATWIKKSLNRKKEEGK